MYVLSYDVNIPTDVTGFHHQTRTPSPNCTPQSVTSPRYKRHRSKVATISWLTPSQHGPHGARSYCPSVWRRPRSGAGQGEGGGEATGAGEEGALLDLH